ncbi:cation channel sperm-associated protein 1-like [Narcine bancroftii]|uniref:cation channel sperm-associated protein 1-like n=1 Tax=Narcine bancroftii TaxID=1343680 RepID=UPI00383195C7
MYVDGQTPYSHLKPAHGGGYIYRRELAKVDNSLRLTVKDFIESPMVGTFILSTVLINIAMVVSQTYMAVMVRAGWFLSAMDSVFMAVYISEYIIKVFVWRKSFFKNFWNDLGEFRHGWGGGGWGLDKLGQGGFGLLKEIHRTLQHRNKLLGPFSLCQPICPPTPIEPTFTTSARSTLSV